MRGRQELAQEDTVENEEQDPETIRAQEETREGAVRQHLTDTIYVQIWTAPPLALFPTSLIAHPAEKMNIFMKWEVCVTRYKSSKHIFL